MGNTRFQHTVMGGSRVDGAILRSRNRRKVDWIDWVCQWGLIFVGLSAITLGALVIYEVWTW